MLSVRNIVFFYGKAKALNEVSADVNDGYITSLLGTNGAGKTTLVNTISGFMIPAKGTISFSGEDLIGKSPEEIVYIGISQVSQSRDLFIDMTALENLILGAATTKVRELREKKLQEVFQIFPILSGLASRITRGLSGGEQQMLAIGRALMANPKLILMDEPFTGLAPMIVRSLSDTIKALSIKGIGILLVEQNLRVALDISQFVYCLRNGEVVLEGDCDKVKDEAINGDIWFR